MHWSRTIWLHHNQSAELAVVLRWQSLLSQCERLCAWFPVNKIKFRQLSEVAGDYGSHCWLITAGARVWGASPAVLFCAAGGSSVLIDKLFIISATPSGYAANDKENLIRGWREESDLTFRTYLSSLLDVLSSSSTDCLDIHCINSLWKFTDKEINDNLGPDSSLFLWINFARCA